MSAGAPSFESTAAHFSVATADAIRGLWLPVWLAGVLMDLDGADTLWDKVKHPGRQCSQARLEG